MLSLKIATSEDTYDILDLVEELFLSSIYNNMTFSKQDTLRAIKSIIDGKKEDGTIVLLKKDKQTIGLLGCSIVEQMFNRKERTAVELAFWIKPEHRNYTGLKLLVSAYVFWAKRTGCTNYLLGKMKDEYTVETYVLRKIKR